MDGHPACPRIGWEFARNNVVNHARGEYVREGFHHSNAVESYFAVLKRGIIRTFHSLRQAHLHRYLAEFDFRYNTRTGLGFTGTQRTDKALQGSTGKRLTYWRTSESAYA